jgi:hypothetical protein
MTGRARFRESGQQLTFDEAFRARDEALDRLAVCAGPKFGDQAAAFVVEYLRTHGPQTGERLTDECWVAGIRAPNPKAVGGVYLRLLRRGLIEVCGSAPRRKGHGTSGGKVYRLAKTPA